MGTILKNSRQKLWIAFLSTAALATLFLGYQHDDENSSVDFIELSSQAPDNSQVRADLGVYLNKIQPIFDGRCIACHSCYNSPCQLDLTSFEGLARGAHKKNIYDFGLTKESKPTRLGIDAHSPKDWEKLGFFSVLKPFDRNLNQGRPISTLEKLLEMKKYAGQNLEPLASVETSRSCPDSETNAIKDTATDVIDTEVERFAKLFPASGMPYGLPPLEADQFNAIQKWLANGAQGPSENALKVLANPGEANQRQIIAAEAFLNGTDFKSRLTARYIYEHLFLAHIYFDESEKIQKRPAFFRLVRAKNKTGWPQEIATPRPMNDPGPTFYYRFMKYTRTIVYKNHLPYLINSKKLAKWRSQFLESSWSNENEILPPYGREGVNPFTTFKSIPAAARARFLVDDAHYHTMSFIKGPVCNGAVAVGVIDDNFWVLYVDPSKDISVIDPDYFNKNADLLALPVVTDISDLRKTALAKIRTNHLAAKLDKYLRYQQKYPRGLGLDAIWDGDGHNANALLTVYRHTDSATVLKGAHGQTPKTIWLLDYPTFEDIYYNLVAEYNVFGPLPHQITTRRYMDHSRVDAQDMFINLLPLKDREAVRNLWTTDPPSETSSASAIAERMQESLPNPGKDFPTSIQFKGQDVKGELLSQILSQRLNAKVRGPVDQINSGTAYAKNLPPSVSSVSEVESWLASIAGRPAIFSNALPDVGYLRVRFADNSSRIYTMIHNVEHYNVSHLFGESSRLHPEMDSINFIPGIAAAYPNIYFEVEAAQIPEFVKLIQSLDKMDKTERSWKLLLKNFAVLRSSDKIWPFNDWVTEQSLKLDPIEGGPLDLSRYLMDQ